MKSWLRITLVIPSRKNSSPRNSRISYYSSSGQKISWIFSCKDPTCSFFHFHELFRWSCLSKLTLSISVEMESGQWKLICTLPFKTLANLKRLFKPNFQKSETSQSLSCLKFLTFSSRISLVLNSGNKTENLFWILSYFRAELLNLGQIWGTLFWSSVLLYEFELIMSYFMIIHNIKNLKIQVTLENFQEFQIQILPLVRRLHFDPCSKNKTKTKLLKNSENSPENYVKSNIFNVFLVFYSAASPSASYEEPIDYSPQESLSHADKQRIEDDTYCNPNGTYVWCLPKEYNREKHPFACKFTISRKILNTRKIMGKWEKIPQLYCDSILQEICL